MATPQLNWLDKAIAYLSPQWAAQRLYFRDAMSSYRGGVANRTSRPWGTEQPTVNGGYPSERHRLVSMRDRARQLDRDNALAASLLDRATENVIGVGIGLKSATDSPAFNEEADALFGQWCRVCDIRGMLSFGGLQRMAYRQKLRDGDVGCILVERGGEPRLQLIEGDRIVTPDDKHSDPSVIDGVQVNRVGRPVLFHVLTADPYGKRQFVPVTASNFVFLPRLRKSNDVRGLTAFAQGFQLFDHIDGYVEGSVIAARAAANQALMIKKHNAANAFNNLGSATNGNGASQKIQRMEPGMVHYLNPDEDVVQMNPAHPTQSFPDFVAALSRFVGLNFGLTLEQVMLDFSRTNYSSARAARLQADATAYVEQCEFYEVFLSRVWQWWISKMVNAGAFTAAVPEDYWAHEWIPQGKPWVDPSKEIDAAIREVKELGISAPSFHAMERGYAFRKVCQMLAEDEAIRKENGLPPILSVPADKPATHGKPDGEDDENTETNEESND